MTNTRVPPLSAANSTIGKSVEGKGKEVVKGDSERFTTEVVGSMHEVGPLVFVAMVADKGVAEATNGQAGYWGFRRAARRVRDIRRDDGDDHLESGEPNIWILWVG